MAVLMKEVVRTVGLLTVTALALTACQAPASYAPRDQHTGSGYTDQQLSANRYRVTFTGNSSTQRETVENYLLLRAAEVTLQAGYPYFLFDTRDTEAKTTYHSTTLDPWPAWRGRGWYHHNWGWDNDVTTRPVTSYEAYAEIVLLTGKQAADEPQALAAQDVVGHIGPLVPPPKP